jgi:hypothetical protein
MMNTDSSFAGVAINLQSADCWTTAQAASELNFSERRIRRLLQRGVLTGSKVRGRFGDEWRIQPFDPAMINDILAADLAGENKLANQGSKIESTQEGLNLSEHIELDPQSGSQNVFYLPMRNEIDTAIKTPKTQTSLWQIILGFMEAILQCLGKGKICCPENSHCTSHG